jgi:hypothetical protein
VNERGQRLNTRSNRRKFGPVFLALAGLAVLAHPVDAKVVEARKAYDFVDSLGVVTHVNRQKGVLDDAGWSKISDAIAEAGFRYVRTTVVNNDAIARVRNMHEKYGTKFNLRIDSRAIEGNDGQPLNPGAIDGLVEQVKRVGANAILSFEGPNEYNSQGKKHGNRDWVEQLKTFTLRMYERIKSDPAIADKPVIAPSIWNRRVQDYRAVGDISDRTDKGCLHNYTGGRLPSYDLDARLRDAKILTPHYPIWVTEYGYRTAAKFAVSEIAKAKYLPRFAAEFFIRPEVERAFNYQIIDEWPITEKPDKSWGLLGNDFSKRPAYHAMKNTIALLDDKDGNFAAGNLDYDLGGDLKDVHSFLVQKKNGTFYLVLWQEVPSYDPDARKDLHTAPRPVTLRFNTPVAEVRTYLPTGLDIPDPETARSPVKVDKEPKSIELEVPDQLLIVEIVVS